MRRVVTLATCLTGLVLLAPELGFADHDPEHHFPAVPEPARPGGGNPGVG